MLIESKHIVFMYEILKSKKTSLLKYLCRKTHDSRHTRWDAHAPSVGSQGFFLRLLLGLFAYLLL